MNSNRVIIEGVRVALPDSVRAAGGRATNWVEDAEPHLANARRSKPLTTLVLHETAGNTAGGCKRTLLLKKLGIHLIVDKDGTISNHADLATELCWHASQANKVSIGIEVVNPYRPEHAVAPRGPVLPAAWWTWVPPGAPKAYQAPTDVQVRVIAALVPWLCVTLGIPWAFPTAELNAKKPRITGWKRPPLGWSAKPGAGIVAHRDFASHSDGRYLLGQVMEGAHTRA